MLKVPLIIHRRYFTFMRAELRGVDDARDAQLGGDDRSVADRAADSMTSTRDRFDQAGTWAEASISS
jgi:hypothetical protein